MYSVGVQYTDEFKRRDLIGIHPQKQEGLSWACACVPAGRVTADDWYEFARVAETCAPPSPPMPYILFRPAKLTAYG